MRIQDLKTSVVRIGKAAPFVAGVAVMVIGMMADPALAQQINPGSGGDAPFAPGVSTGLNWVQFLGAAIAVFAFIGACVALFMRQVMAAGAAFLFVLIGAAFIARSNEIITLLTGLTFS